MLTSFTHLYFAASGQAVVTGVVPSRPRFLPGKSLVDLSEEELMQGLKRFAGVDMQPDIPCAEDGCERAGR